MMIRADVHNSIKADALMQAVYADWVYASEDCRATLKQRGIAPRIIYRLLKP